MKDLDNLVTDVRASGARPILITHAVRATVPPRPEDSLLLLGWRLYSPRATTETSLRFEASSPSECGSTAQKESSWRMSNEH